MCGRCSDGISIVLSNDRWQNFRHLSILLGRFCSVIGSAMNQPTMTVWGTPKQTLIRSMYSRWISLAMLITPIRKGRNCPVDPIVWTSPIAFQTIVSSMPMTDQTRKAPFKHAEMACRCPNMFPKTPTLLPISRSLRSPESEFRTNCYQVDLISR